MGLLQYVCSVVYPNINVTMYLKPFLYKHLSVQMFVIISIFKFKLISKTITKDRKSVV